MEIITAADLQRKLGQYQDRALIEPVLVTRNGRERIVLISAEEYRRLKQYDRLSLPVSALSDEELAAIGKAEMPPEYSSLNDELEE